MSTPSPEKMIEELLWQSLKGGHYNVEALKKEVTADSRFDEIGLDSLDLVEFFLRVQDHFGIKMREEDYANLGTINDVQAYVEEKNDSPIQHQTRAE